MTPGEQIAEAFARLIGAAVRVELDTTRFVDIESREMNLTGLEAAKKYLALSLNAVLGEKK